MAVSLNKLEEQLEAVISMREAVELIAMWSDRDVTDLENGFRELENDIRIQLQLMRKGVVNRPENVEMYATTRCGICKIMYIFRELIRWFDL